VAKRVHPKRLIQASWGGATIERARHFLEHPKTERVLAGLIMLNALVLGLETSQSLMKHYDWLLDPLDHLLLGIFVVEVFTRLVVTGRGFFRDPWNVFDFIVVTLSLMPQTGPLSVLRALRILRVLRLVSAVPTLRRVVGGLIESMPGIGAIAFLLTLVYYCFAVMATNLFGPDHPEAFGTMGRSAYSLFTVMTLEGWNELANQVMKTHPYAWLFFIPYILTTTFTVLNLHRDHRHGNAERSRQDSRSRDAGTPRRAESTGRVERQGVGVDEGDPRTPRRSTRARRQEAACKKNYRGKGLKCLESFRPCA